MRILFLFLILLSFQIEANIKASVDTQRVKFGSNLQLNISSDNAAGKSPNLTILKRNFQILGSSKVSRPYVKNGVKKRKTLWFYILRPKSSGTLHIPSIRLNGQKTKSIKIRVIAPKKRAKPIVKKKVIVKKTAAHNIIVKATINKKKLYPNEILVYNLSINYPENIDSKFIVTPPFIPGAIIIALEKPNFEQLTLRGKARTVQHQSYAIFAQQVALYNIEPAEVSFIEPSVSTSSTVTKPRETILKANSLHFEIMPKANQTSLGYWLPSNKLELEQSWEGLDKLALGQTVIRTIKLKVYGVNSDILPLISSLTHDKIQIKLEDVSVENSVEEGILVATRTEKIALTFKSSGNISIPPIDIHWWNTTVNQARISTLDAKSFIIPESIQQTPLPNINGSKTVTSKAIKQAGLLPKDTNGKPLQINESRKVFSDRQLNWVILILFLLLVGTTLGWLLHTRKLKPKTLPP